MARLPLIVQNERQKIIGLALTSWLEMCAVANSFLVKLGVVSSLHTYRPRIRSYILDFYAQRDYVKDLYMLVTRFVLNKNMLVDEQVAMFLHIISHHLKNRVIKHHFNRFGETAEPITTNSTDPRWKWFNVLDWKGSFANGRVLRVVISRRYGLKVPHDKGYQPSTPEEFFNMRHASAHNVIERCFELLKLRWRIIRSPSFYLVKVNNRIIIACCLLYNFIRTYMSIDPIEMELEVGLPSNVINEDEPNIVNIHPSDAWATWRMELANQMIRTLKRDWAIVYNMLSRKDNSDFGWDEHKQLVVAEDVVHKEAGQFRHRSFLYYHQLTAIYIKDRATGKYAQTTDDIVEEIDVEDVAT
ncbi:hypothetical protein Gotur_002023, partial [Gossypium turneri]